MHRALYTISSLLSSIAILLLGSGLLGTLLSLRASLEGWSGTVIGLFVSMYFLGFMVGTVLCPRLIRRAGHIRGFAVVAALGSCTALVYGLWVEPVAWIVTRFVTGLCLVGIYMIIESWLNAQAANAIRGRIFATYMLVNLVFLALGQYLILAGDIANLKLFAVAAMLFSLALVPVALTRLPEPAPVTEVSLNLAELYREAPLGFMGALLAGLIGSAFWGLGPLYALQSGLSHEHIAQFMSAAILGGALLQLPIGHYSDHHDRRSVLFLISALSALFAVIALLIPRDSLLWPAPLMFLYGGVMFSIYPLSVALANDLTPAGDNVETSGNLLMVYGAGALLGPLLAGVLMQWLGRNSLFGYFAACGALLAAFVQYRRWRVPAAELPEEKSPFVPMTRTTQVAIEGLAEAAAGDTGAEAGGGAGTA